MVLEVIFNLYFVQYVKYYAYNHDCTPEIAHRL